MVKSLYNDKVTRAIIKMIMCSLIIAINSKYIKVIDFDFISNYAVSGCRRSG